MLDPETRQIDAAHEAGHAVISILEGCKFAYVSMTSVPGRWNATVEPVPWRNNHRHPYGFAPKRVATSPLAGQWLPRMLHILLAGGEADRQCYAETGHLYEWFTDINDRQKAQHLHEDSHVDQPFEIYIQETTQLVARNVETILAVANVLLRQSLLPFEQVYELVRPDAATDRYYINGWRIES